jgi:hypothetical protein
MYWVREILARLSGLGLWLREIAGWLLVAGGLFLIYICYLFLQEKRIIEAGPLSILGIIVFRGGIHLLKVAVAARICLEAKDRARQDRPARTPPARRPVTTPAGRG